MCFVNFYIQHSLTKYGFWCASERERGGGGGLVLLINNDTLLFLRKNHLSLLFLRNIN